MNDTLPTNGSPANYVAPVAARARKRQQAATVVYRILCIVLIIVILQLWLLTANMNACLDGDESVIWPAAGVSLAHRLRLPLVTILRLDFLLPVPRVHIFVALAA